MARNGVLEQGSRSRWIALVGISIASFVGCTDLTIVNTAIPEIQRGLAASLGQTQWVITLFVMALSAFLVLGGRLADHYGRRRVLYGGMLVFALASLGAGFAGSIGELVLFRFIQGASTSVLYTASTAIVADMFPEHERGRAVGIVSTGGGAGLALGPIAGGILVGLLDWRWVFFINVPFLVLSFVLCLPRVPESRGAETNEGIDWWGAGLLISGLSCLLLALSQGLDWGWTSPVILALLAAAAAILAVFGLVQHRGAAPLLPLGLLGNGRFLLVCLTTICLGFFYAAALFLMPLYLAVAGGHDSFITGLLLLPATALVALVSPSVGRLADSSGPIPLLIAGLALLALSAGLQALFSVGSGLGLVIAAFAAMGLGWGCILGPSTVAALSSVAPRLGGTAIGVSWTLHNVGGALGLVLATLVYRLAAENAFEIAAGNLPAAAAGLADRVVSEPDRAAALLAGSGIDPVRAQDLAASLFVAGYRASMILLLAVTSATVIALAWAALRWRRKGGRQPAAAEGESSDLQECARS
ncbi:MFS transporter [Labrys sp. La1]|uniref:MFS transporter n=1 Tax=Labrys sp. La1 TaxID=3404917 RepID=UPI003EBB9A57